MKERDLWFLPEGIEEVLPPEAERLEQYRRKILDLFHSWGYELVIPPLIEYLESLLTGTGHDLDLQTFKLIDQLNGRTMGVRGDMTPQVARIDSHRLRRDAPVRLCYWGTVLHTRPNGFVGSRSPLQVGGELFGHAGVESDAEIFSLMLETLKTAGIDKLFVDLGHVGIFRNLAQQARLTQEQEATLFDALQRKACPEIDDFFVDLDVPAQEQDMLRALAELNGGEEVLQEATDLLQAANSDVLRALEELRAIAAAVQRDYPELPLHFDLAELRGYHYHTGAVFAAFVAGHGQEVARGGRYDYIGRVFGHARPATGFSTDLRTLMALHQDAPPVDPVRGIYAPAREDAALYARVRELRVAGERVVFELPGQCGGARDVGCDRRLELRNGTWEIIQN